MNEPQSVTVSALTEQIRNLLEPRFFGISVRGEISNFKKHSSGHLYFTLKDAKAQIGAVMFAASAGRLRAVPKDGDQVLVTGNLNVYPPHGKYQIVVEEMTPLGLGELLMKLEQLKLEIKRRGWFEKEHKKLLPPFPKRIGIVTSPTGAAIQDILNVLSRRFAGVEILLNPVRVQGETAAAEIAQAIEQFNKYQLADVLIVGRGGGSLEDLFAFNEEIVARAVFESAIPIICAVGHETDHCIAEYVADMRAPTPSAAAELVIREKGEILERLKNQKSQLAAL
ncbi:MAG: exodeoxyribonuclease VII large subunit, partial [Chlamydiia bacterium]|nr:exodeoxyribonuclease VII large subunit [Chlamydiia bacterium]